MVDRLLVVAVQRLECFRLVSHLTFSRGLEQVLLLMLVDLGVPLQALVRHGSTEAGPWVPKLKGSIGEGSNHSNFSHQSSVKILSKFNACC